MLTSFKGLKTFQLAEYIFLALFAFTLPMSWRIATYIMIGIFVSCILKGIFEEGFKINKLQYKYKIIYLISIAFWLIYAISFFYSDNTAEARTEIGKKLSFLLFPLFFLCSNLSYLTKDRIRTIMYFFVWGIVMLYLINFVWAFYDIQFKGIGMYRSLPGYFFKTNETIFTTMHRAYLALFTCMGGAFCFVELFTSKTIITKIVNIIFIVLFIISPLYTISRAGLLCTIIILLLMWYWLTFILKRKKIGIATGVVILCSLIVGYVSFPKSINRITDTINNIRNGKGDCRITIIKGNRSLVNDHLIFGVGAGDRKDKTLDAYNQYRDYIISNMIPDDNVSIDDFIIKRQILLDNIDIKFENHYPDNARNYIDIISETDNCDYSSVKDNLSEYQTINHCIKYRLNAHNQYIETMIAVGILGLILLLGLLFIPMYISIKYKRFDIVFFSLLIIIAFNCLFESVFERQMGIMFFTFFYFLLFHATFCQDNDTVKNR